MFEYMIKEAISEYMRETGKSKREAIYKANEIIKALGQECRAEEQRNICLSCGFWDYERSGCSCSSLDMWYACPIEAEKPENKKVLEDMREGRRC